MLTGKETKHRKASWLASDKQRICKVFKTLIGKQQLTFSDFFHIFFLFFFLILIFIYDFYEILKMYYIFAKRKKTVQKQKKNVV